MLHNTRSFLSPIETGLLELKNSRFDFFLTGSRFFGGAEYESDWDFIVIDSSAVQDYLIANGYRKNEAVDLYLDPMTTMVYTRYFCPCEEIAHRHGEEVSHSDECPKIDIQCCSEFQVKLEIRDILKESFKGKLPGDKYQRSKLWNMVYGLVKKAS